MGESIGARIIGPKRVLVVMLNSARGICHKEGVVIPNRTAEILESAQKL